jgi:UDP-N-acetylmuramate--alanine ligase
VRDLLDDFCSALGRADMVIVGPLYSAGEAPIVGIDNAAIAEGILDLGHTAAVAVDTPQEIAPLIRRHARPGDIVICFGAGNSTEWAQKLPAELADEPLRAGGLR